MYPIDFLWAAARRHPDRPAVLHPAGQVTFRDLAARVEEFAGRILAADATPGGFCAVGADNGVAHLVAILGALAAGKIWVPLNPRNGDPELVRILEFIGPALVLGDDPMAARLRGLGADARAFAALPPAGGALPMGPGVAAAIPLYRTQAIKFTGGTTGLPKGVQQPLRAWNATIVTQIHHLGLGPEDRYLVSAPLTHGTSTYMLPFLGVGGALVFPEAPRAPALLDAASRHGATFLYAPPTQILNLIEEQRRAPRDLRALRQIIYGSGPMRPEQIRSAQAMFGPIVGTCYGQTEAPQMICFLAPSDMHGEALASVGRATVMTRVAIVDEAGREVPCGTQGEIAVRGDLLMAGYYNAPEVTARTIVDGWLRTGDAGTMDDTGLVFLRDRLKEVIITGGFNVYPSDVETVLARHPAVLNCAVLGIEDPHWGEAVHAAVEFRDGHSADPAELLALVRAELGPVKTPKRLHLFTSLPRNPVGKVLKTAIRDEILQRETDHG